MTDATKDFEPCLREVESLRQQLAVAHQTSDLNADALEEAQQQLAECQAERDEARANDKCAMTYLSEVRAVVGGKDFPDMVTRVSALQAKYDECQAERDANKQDFKDCYEDYQSCSKELHEKSKQLSALQAKHDALIAQIESLEPVFYAPDEFVDDYLQGIPLYDLRGIKVGDGGEVMNRQCPSCGGFCKKSGCERENVKPEQSVQSLHQRIAHLEEVIRSHGIPVKSACEGGPWYCMGEK